MRNDGRVVFLRRFKEFADAALSEGADRRLRCVQSTRPLRSQNGGDGDFVGGDPPPAEQTRGRDLPPNSYSYEAEEVTRPPKARPEYGDGDAAHSREEGAAADLVVGEPSSASGQVMAVQVVLVAALSRLL